MVSLAWLLAVWVAGGWTFAGADAEAVCWLAEALSGGGDGVRDKGWKVGTLGGAT